MTVVFIFYEIGCDTKVGPGISKILENPIRYWWRLLKLQESKRIIILMNGWKFSRKIGFAFNVLIW